MVLHTAVEDATRKLHPSDFGYDIEMESFMAASISKDRSVSFFNLEAKMKG